MKKATAIILSALLVLSCLTVLAGAAAWDGTSTEAYTGSGTEADPYVIDTPAKLAKIGEIVAGGDSLEGKYFTQTADIDLGGKEWTPIGDGTTAFSGIYNGYGHKITGFSITKISNFTGLFGKLVAGAVEAGVCNLTIEGAITVDGDGYNGETVLGSPSVGAVVGQVNNNGAVAGKVNAVFTNIVSKVDVTLNNQTQQPRAGGLFGQMYFAVVENCVNDGNLSTTATKDVRLGGFTGQFARCDFKGCVNNGNVTAVTTGNVAIQVAGFAAFSTAPAKEADGNLDPRGSVIENSINNGNISGECSGQKGVCVAGFVGNFWTNTGASLLTIKNCLNTGKITSTQAEGGDSYSYAGGFLGNGPSSTDYVVVDNCVSTVSVADITSTGGKGKRAGAFAGAFYANTKEHMSITNVVSAADDTLPMGEAYKTPNQDAEKATWIYADAQKASSRAAEIKGAIAKSFAKINGIEVTVEQTPVNPDPTPSNPTTGDAAVWTLIVASVALIGAAVALKARKEN